MLLLLSLQLDVFQDGHEIHHAIPVIFKAAELGIEIVSYPPHSTDALQGLDKVVFGPLKRAWTNAVNQQVRTSMAIQKEDFARLYQTARETAMTSTQHQESV